MTWPHAIDDDLLPAATAEPQELDARKSRWAFDELSLGEAYAQSRSNRLRYDHTRQCWYRWNNYRWEMDNRAQTIWDASKYLKILCDTHSEGKRLRMSQVRGVLERARSEPGIAVTQDAWDRDDYLLGTPHNTIDLRDGDLIRCTPEHHITKATNIDPSGDCPRWREFISEISQGNPDLEIYLQIISGYFLTGWTKEQAMFFLYGPGGNGKSVFAETLAYIMGDYAVTVPPETFAMGGFDRHPTEIARMAGARLVYASETSEGRRWNAARIKQLTGGDKIAARFMRQDFFEFTPRFKILILGNHKPSLQNVTEAERRRLHVIPLEFVPHTPDRDLQEKLRSEAAGILEWAIEGAHLWRHKGLAKPHIVAKATEEYFAEQDTFRQWLEEDCQCEPGNSNLLESAANLYRSWRSYAENAGEDIESQKSFGNRLRNAGLSREIKRNSSGKNTRVWLGIKLSSPLPGVIRRQSY